jgi:hypothetical protein
MSLTPQQVTALRTHRIEAVNDDTPEAEALDAVLADYPEPEPLPNGWVTYTNPDTNSIRVLWHWKGQLSEWHDGDEPWGAVEKWRDCEDHLAPLPALPPFTDELVRECVDAYLGGYYDENGDASRVRATRAVLAHLGIKADD